MAPVDTTTRRLIEQVKKAVGELEEHLDRGGELEHETGVERWFRDTAGPLLSEVLEAGGAVSIDQWRQIGRRRGYDPRGLGGFFSGKRPAMRAEGDLRVLTRYGQDDVSRWRAAYGKDN
jgi:hypothetical protein